MVEIIHFKDYSFKYANSEKLSLSNLNLTVDKGDFLLLIGKTGSGKSTLLKQLKPDLIVGEVSNGSVDKTGQVSYLSQFVDNQMITESARDEFNFILENANYSENQRQTRIAEISNYFGIVDLLDLGEEELSGGQKQLINLAAAIINDPDVLLLDEPTSQLDPVASEKLLQMVHKINTELNVTVILVEHSLERNVFFANRMAIIESGSIILDGEVDEVLKQIFNDSFYKNYLPQIDRSYLELSLGNDTLPLSNRQFNKVLTENKNHISYFKRESILEESEEVLRVKSLSFKFEYESKKIIDNVSFSLCRGKSYCLVGPNGVGKSTLIRVISQQLLQQSGSIKLNGKSIKNNSALFENIFIVPQDPSLLFVADTVFGEIEFQLKQNGATTDSQVDAILAKYDLLRLKNVSPYDISGGQQEILALVIGLIKKPMILFLDEPTKGLDPNKILKLNELLNEYLLSGGIIFSNSHDLVFATNFDYVSMMFDGKLNKFQTPTDFFRNKLFYTTEINKASRDSFPDALVWKNLRNK